MPTVRVRMETDYARLHAAADRRRSDVRRSLVRAFAAGARSLTDEVFAATWQHTPESLVRAMDWAAMARVLGAPDGTYTVWKAATDTTSWFLGQTYLGGAETQGVATVARLDLVSAHAVEYGETRAGTLIAGIQAHQLDTVRATLGETLRGNYTPDRAGRLLRGTVGLSERQARALVNYERGLYEKMMTGSTSVALRGAGRPLADARYSLRNLNEERIQRMVDRYRERLVNYRAEMIARTETMRASNMGAYAEQIAAGMNGLFDLRTARRIWMTTPDDRACDVCGFLDGQEVGFGEMFVYDPAQATETPGDVLAGETPPIHPMCRCTTYIEITTESIAEAGRLGDAAVFADLPSLSEALGFSATSDGSWGVGSATLPLPLGGPTVGGLRAPRPETGAE